MTNEKMKDMLTKCGFAPSDVEKVSENYDVERISQIVEAAVSPESAFRAIHAFYPELEVESLQKQCDFIMEQVSSSIKEKHPEAVMELTDDELNHVSGGGFFDSIGSWFQENWREVAVAASIVAGAAVVAFGAPVWVGAVVTGIGLLATVIVNDYV